MIDIRQFVNVAVVAERIVSAAKTPAIIFDEIYGARMTHPFPVLGVDELSDVVSTVPVVRRGAAAVPVAGNSSAITYIEPQPIEISKFISARELNDLNMLSSQAVQTRLNQWLDRQLQVVRNTTEALACQSLSGTISYPIRTGAGTDTYSISFGSTLSYTPPVKWDSVGAGFGEINDDLQNILQLLNDNGYGSQTVILAGKSVYKLLMNLVWNSQGKIEAKTGDTGLLLGGYLFRPSVAGYRDPATGVWTPAVAAKDIKVVATDAPFRCYYCAIDDINAPPDMPVYATTIPTDDPSGYKLLTKSKPLPVPVCKAICNATVLT